VLSMWWNGVLNLAREGQVLTTLAMWNGARFCLALTAVSNLPSHKAPGRRSGRRSLERGILFTKR
jgi:hypothetical protein